MKLKIIINKMTNFINKITENVMNDKTKIMPRYRFNYYNDYSMNIGLIPRETRDKIIRVINDNNELFDSEVIKNITHYFNIDTSNESVLNTSNENKNYVIYCMYLYILDIQVRRYYNNNENIVHVKDKIRPDKYSCEIIDHYGEFLCDAFCKILSELPITVNFKVNLDILKKINAPMPYYDIYDNIIVYEQQTQLDPHVDPLEDVLKDIVNQLKAVNKYFWFQYIDKTSIGKSNFGFKRYFIFFLESLKKKDERITTYNVYDGRYKYDSISPKDQLRTVINILSEIYISGSDSYKVKSKIHPFCRYLDFILTNDETNIYEDFILYLMHIKND